MPNSCSRFLFKVSVIFPCGFCGQSSRDGSCKITIKSGKAVSTCFLAYNFMIHAAGKISKTKPSTNVPIQCIFCPRDRPSTHWKYNIQRHLDERHPSWRTCTGKEASTFIDAVQITDEEEKKLGIPEDKRGCNVQVRADSLDARRLGRLPSINDCHGESPRRNRQPP